MYEDGMMEDLIIINIDCQNWKLRVIVGDSNVRMLGISQWLILGIFVQKVFKKEISVLGTKQ